jgi:hypothetical protein
MTDMKIGEKEQGEDYWEESSIEKYISHCKRRRISS